MELRTSARDKDLALNFHKLTATDSAQAAQPLRRLTQATAETVYRTADPYAVAGWDQGSGDDYSDRASHHLRSGAPRYSGPERAAARPTYRTATPYDYGTAAPAHGGPATTPQTPRTQQPSLYGHSSRDPYRPAYQSAPTGRSGSATTNTGGATTGGGTGSSTLPLRRYDGGTTTAPQYRTPSSTWTLTPSGQPVTDPAPRTTAGTSTTGSTPAAKASTNTTVPTARSGSGTSTTGTMPAAKASTNTTVPTARSGSATTNTGGATTGGGTGSALVHDDPAVLIRPGTPLDVDGPLHQGTRLTTHDGLLVDDLEGPLTGRMPLRPAGVPDGDPMASAAVTPRERLLARAGKRGLSRTAAPSLDPTDPTAPVGRIGKTAVRGKASAAGRTFGPGRGALGGNLRRGRLAAAGATRATDPAPTGLSAVTRLIGLPGTPSQGASALANIGTMLVQQGQRAIAAVVAGLAGTSGAALAIGAAVILAILAVVVSFLPWLQWQHEQESGGAMLGGAIAPGTPGVPAELIPLYNKAGTICPEMPATVLAAQGHQESGFNPRAVSPVGAQGIAQFMPGTWATYGKDANGDGKADPFDPADAIDAQGRFMCDLVAQMKQLKDSGKATGDLQVLALSAYNAGTGAIATYHGVPPYPETQAYAPAIMAYAQTLGATLGGISVTGDYAGVIEVLKSKLGTPYAYGGGGPTGPGPGWYGGTVGWDCSSFMQYGFYQATKGAVMLPRTAAAQAQAYPSVPLNALQPGDLIFWSNSTSLKDIHHVAMYVGNGQMIEEPHTGAVARLVPVYGGVMHAVRVPLK